MFDKRAVVNVLKSGGVILYNTDTIPGLGCDATNKDAVEKIYAIKERPAEKSLILLVSNDGMLQRYVERVPDVAWDIIDFAEKPTTIIYPKAKNLAANLVADDGSIGIRMIKKGPLNELIEAFGRPLVSTSANLSGAPGATSLSEIVPEITSKVDLIVDLPTQKRNQASTIIKIELNGEFKIIRK
ncbi:L-threonylcarbamoyladenylate synthase [Parvicella tangerina]|uniref:L-threonylcarbamoyladenylate synthase n=1 Tax=Parvicella tangerina TaxID=2829795 RepID=A0A916N8G5_9FLAO|nr:L-threonylcarbamoyladenylate synthase [Parvicella tangerina]CAG5076974.1 Threonylcarbamoyl-AMP synthase [Parvicella tangerina]